MEEENRITYSDSPETIIKKIANAANITYDEVINGNTADKFVVPRHLCCYYTRMLCKDKYNDTELSHILNVSRSSIIVSYNKINTIFTSKQNMRRKYKDIYDQVNPTQENTFKNKLVKTVETSFILAQLQEKCASDMSALLGDTPASLYQKASISSINMLCTTFRNYISNMYNAEPKVDINRLYAKFNEIVTAP